MLCFLWGEERMMHILFSISTAVWLKTVPSQRRRCEREIINKMCEKTGEFRKSRHPILFQLFLWNDSMQIFLQLPVRLFPWNVLAIRQTRSAGPNCVLPRTMCFLTSQHNTSLSHHINTCCFLWACMGDFAYFGDNAVWLINSCSADLALLNW